MPEILLFSKPQCQKCDYVKERIPAGLAVDIIDTSTADGLAQAAFCEIIGRTTPVLVVDGQVTEGAIAILARLNELAGSS